MNSTVGVTQEWVAYHSTTKVRSPRSNSFVERMNRTLHDEHFRIKGRGKCHESVEEIQVDLDAFIEFYNLNRPLKNA